jgi:hypothetical protein
LPAIAAISKSRASARSLRKTEHQELGIGRARAACGADEQPHPGASLEVDHDQRIDVVQVGFGVTGRRGRVFETITPDAMKDATDISESNPTWKWAGQDPRATR